MNAKLLTICLGTALAGALTANAGGPYYLTAAASNIGNVAFDSADSWLDADGNAYAGETVFDPDGEYYVLDGRILLTHYGWKDLPDTLFTGKSLTLGSVANAKSGNLHFYQNGNYKIEFSKLILERGQINHSFKENSANTIDGPVLVRSTLTNPYQFINYYVNCSDTWTGNFSTESDQAGILIGGGANENYTFIAKGDWSDYAGTVTVRKSNTKNNVAFDITYRPQTSSSFPGTLSLETNTVLSALNATDVFTVKNLTLAGGMKIVVAATASANSQIVVDEAFAQTGLVTLDASAVTSTADGRSATLLTVPISCTLDKTNFQLDDATLTANGHLFVDDNGDNTQSLKLVFYATIYQTVTDGGDHKTQMASSLLVAEHWSDGFLPHDRADYQVKPDANNKAVYLHTPKVEKYEFPGESLTCFGWCYLYQWCNELVCKKLVIRNKSRLYLGGVASGKVGRISGGELCAESGIAYILPWAAQTLEVASALTGEADVRLEGAHGTSYPDGNTYLMVPNEDFTGTLTVTQQIAGTEARHQTLFIGDGRALGGALAAFNPAALTLTQYGTLATTNAALVTLENDVNRGILALGDAALLVGTHENNPTTLRVKQPLTFDGTLRKNGAGILELAAESTFRAADGSATATPSAEVSRQTLFVREGTVKVSQVDALNGVSLMMNTGAKFLLDPTTEDADLKTYGIRNVKTETPFRMESDGDATTIEIELDAAAKPAAECEVAVLTVPRAQKTAVANLLKVRGGANVKPYYAIEVTPVDVTVGDLDCTTFKASLTRKGGLILLVE